MIVTDRPRVSDSYISDEELGQTKNNVGRGHGLSVRAGAYFTSLNANYSIDRAFGRVRRGITIVRDYARRARNGEPLAGLPLSERAANEGIP